MTPEPPLPVAAYFSPGTGVFRVVFDRQLRTDPAVDIGNWRVSSGLMNWWVGQIAAARGFSVYGVMLPTFFGPPPGILQYDPPPLDVFGRLGGVVAAFQIPWTLP